VRLVALAVALCGVLLGPSAAAAAPRLRPADSEAIRAVLSRYVPAVLERKDVRLGYQLSGPQVRGTTTLREWLHGGVPVYPFPARGDRIEPDSWTLTYVDPSPTRPTDVGLDLMIQPRKGAKAPAIAFRIEMTKIRGAWKVNAFYPEATFRTGAAKVFSPQDATGNGATPQAAQTRISGAWLALPAGLIGAVVLLGPLAYLVLARRRDRRAYRDYLERTGG
jgi:hypothetical protein